MWLQRCIYKNRTLCLFDRLRVGRPNGRNADRPDWQPCQTAKWWWAVCRPCSIAATCCSAIFGGRHSILSALRPLPTVILTEGTCLWLLSSNNITSCVWRFQSFPQLYIAVLRTGIVCFTFVLILFKGRLLVLYFSLVAPAIIVPRARLWCMCSWQIIIDDDYWTRSLW